MHSVFTRCSVSAVLETASQFGFCYRRVVIFIVRAVEIQKVLFGLSSESVEFITVKIVAANTSELASK